MRVLALLTLISLTAAPLAAKAPWVKKAKDAGIAQIKDCKSCHTTMPATAKDLTEVGHWLVDQKKARKATECDMTWLKEYYAKKK